MKTPPMLTTKCLASMEIDWFSYDMRLFSEVLYLSMHRNIPVVSDNQPKTVPDEKVGTPKTKGL